MTTAEVATQLVALCQKGEFDQAMNSLYAENITSLEACEMPEMPNTPKVPRETNGLAGVRKKAEWWNANHTVHSVTTTGPFISVEKFAVIFALDATFKPTGKRHQINEVAIYTVADGKIIREEFLYEAK